MAKHTFFYTYTTYNIYVLSFFFMIDICQVFYTQRGIKASISLGIAEDWAASSRTYCKPRLGRDGWDWWPPFHWATRQKKHRPETCKMKSWLFNDGILILWELWYNSHKMVSFSIPYKSPKNNQGPFFHCSIVANSTILYELQQRWNLAKPRALFHCQFLPIFWWLAWVFDWAALTAMKLIIANPLPHALKKRPGWYTSIFTGFLFLVRFNNCGYIFSLPHQWLQFFAERVILVAGVVGLAVECGIPAEKMPQADPAPYGMARFIWGVGKLEIHMTKWKMKKKGPWLV